MDSQNTKGKKTGLSPAIPTDPQTEDEKLLHVVHRNDFLLEASMDLSANQLRMLWYLISQLPRHEQDEMPVLEVPVETVKRIFHLEKDTSNSKSRIATILDDMAKQSLVVKNAGGGVRFTPLFEYIDISDDHTKYAFQMQQFLSPFLLQLSEKFVSYELDYVMDMRSSYAIRLYDTLRIFLFRGSIVIPLAQLKQYLGQAQINKKGEVVELKKYAFGDFHRDTLKPAIKEINEKSDLMVDYSFVKGGPNNKSVVAVKFVIGRKKVLPAAHKNFPMATYVPAEEKREEQAKRYTPEQSTVYWNSKEAIRDIEEMEEREKVVAEFDDGDFRYPDDEDDPFRDR